MPMFQVRNSRTRIVLGEVSVDDPELVLDALAETTGTTIEEIAHSLGSTVDEAMAALDIIEVKVPRAPVRREPRTTLPPRDLFA